MKQKYFFIIAMVLCVAMKSFSQDKPSWIDTPQNNYPNVQFLTSVGVGDTRKGAENNALANLSTMFEASIKAENTITERYKELFAGESSTMEKSSEVAKDVTVSSSQTLSNVQFAESFTDKMGQCYVLAVLERVPTAKIYQKKMELNAQQITFYTTSAQNTNDDVMKFAYLNAASVISQMNEALKKQLVIILPGAQNEMKLQYDHNELMKQLSEAMKKIIFSVALTNDAGGKVATMVKELISTQGFVVSDKSVLAIVGDVHFEQIDLQRPEKYVRWNYQLSVNDVKGNTVVTLSENGREGHLTYEEAKARSLRTIKEKIKISFAKEINKYFDGVVKK